MVTSMKPIFFTTADASAGGWMGITHGKRAVVGFYKEGVARRGSHGSGRQALCYGWIDGIKKRVDEDRYTHRFSPRTAKSTWSAINIKRVGELTRLDRMHPCGLEVFQNRDRSRAGLYSFENRPQTLAPALARTFRANKQAWAFFQAQPPGYRRVVIFMVMSAKQDATKERRLARLIEASEKGRRLL